MKITIIKVNKNGGPEEDRGLCVVWRPEARQDWVTEPWWVLMLVLQLLEAGKSYTTSHGGTVHLGKSLSNVIDVDKWD